MAPLSHTVENIEDKILIPMKREIVCQVGRAFEYTIVSCVSLPKPACLKRLEIPITLANRKGQEQNIMRMSITKTLFRTVEKIATCLKAPLDKSCYSSESRYRVV